MSAAMASGVLIAAGYTSIVAGTAFCATGVGAPAGLSLIGGGLTAIAGGISGFTYVTSRY
jgi:hypothetical protein